MAYPADIKFYKTLRVPYVVAQKVRELIHLTDVYTNLTSDNYDTEFYYADLAIQDKVKEIETIFNNCKFIG